jgi:glycosyltransferase involved in cell wall biosynthesis
MSKPAISIVLGTYNRLKYLKPSIKSIRDEQKILPFTSEIIVIDGGSTDGTIKWLTKQKDIVSIVQHNRGNWMGKPIKRRSWGYFMNLGFKCAQGKYICMISDDCLIVPKSLLNGYKTFEQKLKEGKKIGFLAFYWREIPLAYQEWSKPGKYFVIRQTENVVLVNHGMFLKKALEENNYINEEEFIFYCSDGDLCFELNQQGYLGEISPNSYIEHYPHANNKTKIKNAEAGKNDRNKFLKKWNLEINVKPPAFTKTYFDEFQTINQFKYAHFTNFEYWIPHIKNIIKKQVKNILVKTKIYYFFKT